MPLKSPVTAYLDQLAIPKPGIAYQWEILCEDSYSDVKFDIDPVVKVKEKYNRVQHMTHHQS